jgi:hypothetical protein
MVLGTMEAGTTAAEYVRSEVGKEVLSFADNPANVLAAAAGMRYFSSEAIATFLIGAGIGIIVGIIGFTIAIDCMALRGLAG